MPIIVLSLLIIFSCAPQPTAPTPDWLLTSNSTSDYWIGIGIIEKPFSGNIREATRSQALNEIASQISIQISSNFTNVMTEYNYDINMFTQSIVDSRVENNLNDIEYLNFHEDEYRFYVQARLSKRKYYEALAKKRENAVQTALGYIQRADKEFNGESFNLLQSAMDEIIQFMDEPLQIVYAGESHNLYSLIKLKFQDKVNQVQLTPLQNEINITFGINKNEKIEIRSTNRKTGKIVSGIPVKIESSENINVVFGVTDANGKLVLPLPKFDSFETQKQILLSMDFQEMKLAPNSYPQTPISIKINSPLIFVDVDEKLLGEESENPIIGPMIKDFFSTNLSANFSGVENADLIIRGNVNTSKRSDFPNEWDIYQTFADATITVINGITGGEVYSVTIPKVQGADFNSNEGSAKEGIKKISINMETNTLPQILKLMQEL
ncbi:MAG: LPP20 family lipoprotein [Candidatus Marinimicrobia bacterium]|nr:LPP20 family lipoprotein [Candidatus Neomarinimicrobiota bacterium]